MLNVLMIGPSLSDKGGIKSVVTNYLCSSLNEVIKIYYVETTIQRGYLYKICKLISGLFYFVYHLCFKRINVVHVHLAAYGSFYRKSLFILIAKVFKKKIIVHLHSGKFDIFYSRSNLMTKKYINCIFSLVDVVIILGKEEIEKVKKYGARNIIVLPNAVNSPPHNLYITNKLKCYLTFLGRMKREKGIYDIIGIATDVIQKYHNIKFLLAGSGEVDKVKKMIKERNLEEYFIVLDWIDGKEKEEILKKTLLFLLPSYHEGMPMAVLEAMSYGIPVITTNVGEIPSLIKNGYNGFMISPGDKQALKEKIIELIEDDILRKKISENAYFTIKNKFNIDMHIKRLVSIYKQLVYEHRRKI